MAIVGIILFLAAPLLFGVGISCKRGERNVGCLKGYLVGFLSLFAVFFVEILAMLKLDLELGKFELTVVGTFALMLVTGLVLLIIKRPSFIRPRFEKRMLWFLIPAILLFAYSYGYVSPSFANDDTWEFVATSVAKGSVYEYSAMTGKLMENGLPIFNKILAMPLLYVVLADFFGISVNVSAGILVPAIVFVLNLAIVYKIGKELLVSNLHYFMILYMLILMSGTYLPSFGLPVTLGYTVLREGYCGFAVAYGVVIPAAVLLLLKKKYFWAVAALVPSVTLIRIDRVFFAVMSPFKSLKEINTAGKLMGIYAVAIAAALILKAVKKTFIEWKVLLIPSVFVAYIAEKIKNCLTKKHESIWYSLGIAVIILSAVNFETFDDSVTNIERFSEEEKVRNCLAEIGGKTVWGTPEFMATARRIDGNVIVLFGRDEGDPKMAGLNYEDGTEMRVEYVEALKNLATGHYWYVTEHDKDYIVDAAASEGAELAALPTENGYSIVNMESLKDITLK